MSLAPWRSPLAHALHRSRSQPDSRYLQLATINQDGFPANRTVVFRGFLDDTNQLKFVTDARSQKVKHIADQPRGEACWYFTKTREQFRIAGKLTLVTNTDLDENLQKARQISWQELSDAARLQFAWPNPGETRAEPNAFAPPPPNPVEALPNFCLLLLNPVEVDHLELRGEPQNRYIYRLDMTQGWLTTVVNP